MSTSVTYNLEDEQFEWNEQKRVLNLEKHHIDFIDAAEIFQDSDRIELVTMRQEEKRYQTIGCIRNHIGLVVYTLRGKNKRIISARLASRKERAMYEKLRSS